MQSNSIPLLMVWLACFSCSSTSFAEDHPVPDPGPPTAVAGPAEAVFPGASAEPVEAVSPGASAEPVEAVSPGASAEPADAAWAEVLAELQESSAVENPTTVPGSVGTPSSPTRDARRVAALAVLLLLGLLAHPRTRSVVLARLGRGPALGTGEDETIEILARRELGAGRRLLAISLNERRLLLAVGPQGVEVLDRWGPPGSEPSEIAPAPAPAEADVQVAPTPDPQVAPTPDPQVAPTPNPQVAEVLAAWRVASRGSLLRSVEEDISSFEADADEDPDAPWWMDGADDAERERIRVAGQEPHLEIVPPPPSRPSPAASVLARLRAARTARKEAPPKPAVARRAARLVLLVAVSCLVPLLMGGEAFAVEFPDAPIRVDLGDGEGASAAVKLLVSLTFLAVLPAIVLSMTSFTRLIVVFSMLRQALAVQQAPPNQILIGLALFLTWFIMGPTFDQVHVDALQPYMDGEMSEVEAVEAAMGPMRDFMLRNTRSTDLALFLRVSGSERPATRDDVPTRVVVPAFLISELKTAFEIGFLIYLPFLVIDLVVSTVLLAMGMMVLPPVVISLPFKLLLFVFVDGWNLLASSLVQGFS
jgi:flagellar biosynthetic protein FliP